MASIPTPIPEAVVELLSRTWTQVKRGALGLTVWRILVLVVGFALFTLLLATGPGFLVAFVVGTVLTALYADDIVATMKDIWDMNFWVWRVD